MSAADHSGLREGILRVSMQLGTELGADGLTMRAIAKRLGVSATALYQHFESKSAILRAIRFEGLQRLNANLEPAFAADDPMERLYQQGVRYIQFAVDNPWLYSLLVDEDEEDWAALGETERADAMKGNAWAYKALQDGLERGQIRRDLDLRQAPVMMWAALHGLASLMLRGRVSEHHPQFPVPDANAMIESYVRAMLRGFQP
jgi:AcrR family transcriptional regulator